MTTNQSGTTSLSA